MRERKEKTKKYVKAGVPLKAGLISAIVIVVLVVAFTFPRPILVQDDEGVWQVIWKGNAATAAEADPGVAVTGAGKSGWLSTFILDYAETPGTCLLSNATAGNYDTWTNNVSGYQSADNADAMDLPSEDPGYFVVRGRFNRTNCHDGSVFHDSRCSIRLTVSGDETISDVEGTRIISYNNSAGDYIYINFYWDDASDGYRILDDGSLAWNVTVSAQF